MKKRIKILLIILGIIILGFIIPIFFPEDTFCTMVAVSCKGLNGENLNREIPENDCKVSNPIFTLGLIHIVKVYSAQEIVTCTEGLRTDSRIDVDKNNYKYKLRFLIPYY